MNVIKSIQDVGEATVMKVLLVPFGTSLKKDLHGEFFDKDTYFGLDIGVTKFYAMYDHHFNQSSNKAAVGNQIIGTATYDETTDEGLWYDIEVKKSHAYHNGIVRLAKEGYLGTSSGTYPGGKMLDSKVPGRIDRWIIGEGSLTVTPAEPDTIGKVIELAKSFNLPVDSLEESLKTEPVAEVEVPVEAEVAVETPAEEVAADAAPSIVDEITEILSDDSQVAEEEVAKSVQGSLPSSAKINELLETTKSIWAMFEVFGSPEEFKESLAVMGEVLSSVRGLDTSVKAISTVQSETNQALKSVAAFMKGIKTAEIREEVSKMSAVEKSTYSRGVDPSTKIISTRPLTHTIPDHAPGG